MEVNTDWKSLRIFIFMDLKRPLNWLKNKMTKIKENLSKTVKQCPEKKCIQISYKKCPISPAIGSVYREVAIERSILRRNVNCDLTRCSLQSGGRYKVSATQRICYESLTVISYVPEKSVCCREVSVIKDVRYKEVTLYFSLVDLDQ